MTAFTFAPATRETAKARIALQGPGGSGKTKTALRFAEALAAGGQIGVVDTERGSALKYAPVPGRPDLGGHEFGHMPMSFCSPENLIAAVKAAEEARLAVLIVDSWSHFWAGKGGLLARVDEEAKKSGNFGGKFTAWGPVNNLEQDMLDALLGFPGHVIVTMRTKNDYSMEGKTVTKVGVKTVQREGAEYEVDVVIDMVAGVGTVTKTRYEGLADITVHHPGPELAETILEQLGQGVDPVTAIVDAAMKDDLTYPAALELHAKAKAKNLLTSPLLHPTTGEQATLDALLRERGLAVKPALAPAAPAVQAAPALDPTPPTAGPGTTAAPAMAPATAEPAPTTEGMATSQQMRKIFATFKDLDFAPERERRLKAVSLLIGRQVPTMNDLTCGEASELIETLADFAQHADDGKQLFRDCLNKLRAEAQPPAAESEAA